MAKKRPDEDFSGYIKTRVNKGEAKEGKKLPNFKVSSTGKEPFVLSDYKGKKLIIYFYPKDHTSGCTQEGHDFTALHKKFKKLNAEVFGVSRESLDSHQKFIDKQGYSFDLLSDGGEEICKLFDVIKEKSMYGRKFMGVERSTFLIDENGKLLKAWRKVKVAGHAEEVFKFTKEV